MKTNVKLEIPCSVMEILSTTESEVHRVHNSLIAIFQKMLMQKYLSYNTADLLHLRKFPGNPKDQETSKTTDPPCAPSTVMMDVKIKM